MNFLNTFKEWGDRFDGLKGPARRVAERLDARLCENNELLRELIETVAGDRNVIQQRVIPFDLAGNSPESFTIPQAEDWHVVIVSNSAGNDTTISRGGRLLVTMGGNIAPNTMAGLVLMPGEYEIDASGAQEVTLAVNVHTARFHARRGTAGDQEPLFGAETFGGVEGPRVVPERHFTPTATPIKSPDNVLVDIGNGSTRELADSYD